MAAPSVDPEHVERARSLRFRIGRVAVVVAVIVVVGFWAWVFTGGPTKANPDRVHDRAFIARTAKRCDTLRDRLGKLPNAASIKLAAKRADVLDQANLQVARTVAAIEKDAPRRGDDSTVVEGWIGDWKRYLQDRRNYAKRLRVDPTAQFVVSESPLKAGVDDTIETFADVNDMPQCATPGDVG